MNYYRIISVLYPNVEFLISSNVSESQTCHCVCNPGNCEALQKILAHESRKLIVAYKCDSALIFSMIVVMIIISVLKACML
jgi:hypothetical protein